MISVVLPAPLGAWDQHPPEGKYDLSKRGKKILLACLSAKQSISLRYRYVIPSLRYAFSDNLWAEIGANFFGGRRNGMFGSMQDNSNVYLTVLYAF